MKIGTVTGSVRTYKNPEIRHSPMGSNQERIARIIMANWITVNSDTTTVATICNA